MNNFKQVSGMLAQRAEEVARYLLPNGKKVGHEWRAGSVDGKQGQSLGVHLVEDKAGVFCDFATGESGDLLTLWSLKRNIGVMAALKDAEEYLGVVKPKFEAHRSKNFTRPKSEKIKLVTSMSPVMDYLLNHRKLTVETIQFFKIGEEGRKIIFPYWRNSELIFVKYIALDRPDGKKQAYVEPDCEPSLFGWDLISPIARTISICEGEIYAMTLYQYGFPSLSVPFGAGSGDKHKWIEYEYERLTVYDIIYLIFDPDTSGKEAVVELVNRLGRYRCRIVTLPYKDPNECLQKGVTKEEIQRCFDEARTLDPDELKPANLFVDQVIDEFYPKEGSLIGYNPPWQYAKDKILFRPNELSIWGGINGHGKSQLLGHIVLSLMQQGARVCIASLEINLKNY